MKTPTSRSLAKLAADQDTAREELRMLEKTIAALQQANRDIRARDQELRHYIREKTNQLLGVMGTLPLKPEELDDETLISVDPIGIVSDSFEQVIEHLHEANANLSLARDEQQAIFDSVGTGILVLDNEMQIVTYNRKSRELFFPDIELEELSYCPEMVCQHAVAPEDCIFRLVMASGRVVENCDFENNGRHFHATGTPIKDKDGLISYVIVVYTDITERMKNERALREAETRLTTILNSTQAGIVLIDPDTYQIVFANPAATGMIGLSEDELQGQICHNFICASAKGKCLANELVDGIASRECVLLTADQGKLPILKAVSSIEYNGKPHLLESIINISERKETEEKLRESEQRYRSLYSNMQEGVAQYRMLYDGEGLPYDYEILDTNPAFETILKLERDQVIGRLASEVYPLTNGKPMNLDVYARVISSGVPINFEFENSDSGQILSISVAPLRDQQFATIFEDITERKLSEEKIERLAYYDNLTGLPNRVLMKDRLNQLMFRARRNSSQIALFFLDLDYFKRINDTLGHDKGDQLLMVIADRLRKVLRNCDSVCRIGGDEFVVLVDDIKSRDDAALIGCKILESLDHPIILSGREVFTTSSIGIALFPDDGEDPETLLKNADAAMYQSKDEGRNTYRFYSSEMNAKGLEQLLLANDLRKALERNEIHIVYQPQIDLSHGQMIGVESLLRWEHPDLGSISPAQFIPLAEETGLILTIGRWVIETACHQVRKIQQRCGYPLRVAVNLSAKQFQDANLSDIIRDVLKETGIPPETLELEITESILMDNIESSQKTLRELKKMGVNLAIDDFGTGYSSLSYLRHFPIDSLKIDRSFIQRICSHPDDASIVEAIVVMGHVLGMRVVAEGVEVKNELDFLRQYQCDEVQGFYFSRPLTTSQLTGRIRESACSKYPFCFFNS